MGAYSSERAQHAPRCALLAKPRPTQDSTNSRDRPKPKSRRGLWLTAAFISVAVIIGAIVGGVVGTHDAHKTSHAAAAVSAPRSSASDAKGSTRSGVAGGNARGVIWPTVGLFFFAEAKRTTG